MCEQPSNLASHSLGVAYDCVVSLMLIRWSGKSSRTLSVVFALMVPTLTLQLYLVFFKKMLRTKQLLTLFLSCLF